MKRKFVMIAAVAMAAALAFVLSGCSLLETPESYTPEEKDPTVTTPAIGKDGVLRVGVNSSNAPFSAQVSGNIVGVDIDVAAALADQMGLELEIVDVGTDPEGALESGSVDIIMNVDTTDTTTTCWTSEPYLESSVALFATDPKAPLPFAGQEATDEASSDEASSDESSEDADSEEGSEEASSEEGESSEGEVAEGDTNGDAQPTGTVVAAQASSMSAWEVSSQYGEDALYTVDDLKSAFNDLSAGKVPYVAADAVIGSYVAHSSAIDANIIGIMEVPSGYCIGASVDNTDLQAAVTDALKSITSSGIVNVIESKWLGSFIDVDSYAKTDAAAAASAEAEAAANESDEEEASSEESSDESSEEESSDEGSGEEITAEAEGDVGANAVEVVDDGGGEVYEEVF